MRLQQIADAAVVVLALTALGNVGWQYRRTTRPIPASPATLPADSMLPRVRLRAAVGEIVIGEDARQGTLVYVFRSDCPACALQRGSWLSLAAEAALNGVRVIAITTEELTLPAVAQYAAARGIVLAAPVDVRAAYHSMAVEGTPATVLIGDNQKIQFHRVGVLTPADEDVLLRTLRRTN